MATEVMIMDEQAHEKWFREQVEFELAEADKPGAEFVSHEEVGRRLAEKLEALRSAIDN
jgi:hypothetical protein